MSERFPTLRVEDLDANPFRQFAHWFDEARDVMAERDAICLSSATAEGRVSSRMVLLRHRDETTFGWYTHYDSRKARELTSNPFAALLWYCEGLGRQVRIEGTVERMTAAASDAYFTTRPRASQIGAHASRQSQPLESREALEVRVRELDDIYEATPVPRPEGWGGFLLTPRGFEFWQHRDDRLHDRVRYEPEDGSWRRERLWP